MNTIIGKTVLSTTEEDTMFLPGENVEDALHRGFSYCKASVVYFEDHTYMRTSIQETLSGEPCIGIYYGEWEERDGQIIVISSTVPIAESR